MPLLASLGFGTFAALVLCAGTALGLERMEPAGHPQPVPSPVAGVPAPATPNTLLTGKVKSRSDGSPVPGARVVAVIVHRGSVLDMVKERLAGRPRCETLSDAHGVYTLTIPVADPHDLVGCDAFKPGFNSFAGVINTHGDQTLPDGTSDKNPGRVFLPLSAPHAQVPDLWLDGPAPYLAGTITDENGQPIPGAMAELYATSSRRVTGGGIAGIDNFRRAVADAQGHFEIFDLPPRPGTLNYVTPMSGRSNTLRVSFWDYKDSEEIRLSDLDDEALRHLRIRINAGNGKAPSVASSAVQESPLIQGRVVDQVDRPLAGARLAQVDPAHPKAPPRELARTGLDGRFVINLPAGSPPGDPLQIQVRYWNLLPTTFTVPEAPHPDQGGDRVVRLIAGYTFQGHLATHRAEPLSGAHLSLVAESWDPHSRSQGRFSLTTDSEGYFCFSDLPPGRFRGEIIDYEHGPKQSFPLDLTGDVLGREVTFAEGPRPVPLRSIVLGGIDWAEMTRDLARFYGYPETTERLIAMKSAPLHADLEGSCMKSLRYGRKTFPGKSETLEGLDDLRKGLAQLLPRQGDPVDMLEITTVASPADPHAGTDMQGFQLEPGEWTSLRNGMTNKPPAQPTNF